MSHKLHSFEFTSLVSESWDSFPDPDKLKKQIAIAVLAHSELAGEVLGPYAPPKEIRALRITEAAFDQVHCMWHGHRSRGHISPPPIPLKFFVYAFGQDASSSWANIEVMPGLDAWEIGPPGT
jgi:hypothetical protein